MPTANTGGSPKAEYQPEADQRQQNDLAEQCDGNGFGVSGDAGEVPWREGQAEPEHDDAERDG